MSVSISTKPVKSAIANSDILPLTDIPGRPHILTGKQDYKKEYAKPDKSGHVKGIAPLRMLGFIEYNSGVKYFNENERKAIEVTPDFKNGLLAKNNKLFNTDDKTEFMYTISTDGKLYILRKYSNRYMRLYGKPNNKHSSPVCGQPVKMAGMMKVKHGKITFIDNDSGHYKPTLDHLRNFLKDYRKMLSPDCKMRTLSWHSKRQIDGINNIDSFINKKTSHQGRLISS
ncbi:MAG: hypothetical protein AAF621_06705 [Pseudomonadota bacterium]